MSFKQLTSLLTTVIREFVDGVKSILGLDAEPSSEVAVLLVSRAVAVFTAVAAFVLLLIPSPALNSYADSLFRVTIQLWGHPFGRIA